MPAPSLFTPRLCWASQSGVESGRAEVSAPGHGGKAGARSREGAPRNPATTSAGGSEPAASGGHLGREANGHRCARACQPFSCPCRTGPRCRHFGVCSHAREQLDILSLRTCLTMDYGQVDACPVQALGLGGMGRACLLCLALAGTQTGWRELLQPSERMSSEFLVEDRAADSPASRLLTSQCLHILNHLCLDLNGREINVHPV